VLYSGRQCVLIARLAAAQVAAFEKLSAEGARTLTVVNFAFVVLLCACFTRRTHKFNHSCEN